MISTRVINITFCLKVFPLFPFHLYFFLKSMKLINILRKLKQRRRNKKRKHRTRRESKGMKKVHKAPLLLRAVSHKMPIWIVHSIQVLKVFLFTEMSNNELFLFVQISERECISLVICVNLLFHTSQISQHPPWEEHAGDMDTKEVSLQNHYYLVQVLLSLICIVHQTYCFQIIAQSFYFVLECSGNSSRIYSKV